MIRESAALGMALGLLVSLTARPGAQGTAEVDPGSSVDVGLPSPTGPELEVVTGKSIDLTTPSGKKLKKAIGKVEATAREEGLSKPDTDEAVSSLAELADAGMSVGHALKIVEAAVKSAGSREEIARTAKGAGGEGGRSGEEIARIARSAGDAFRKGASSRKLANLSEDLAEAGVEREGLATAIEAVGNLAEEGFTGAETGRGVALGALRGLKEGLRGRDLADRISAEARKLGEGERASSERGFRGRSEEGLGRMPEDVRQDMREQPPVDLGEDFPGGRRGRP